MLPKDVIYRCCIYLAYYKLWQPPARVTAPAGLDGCVQHPMQIDGIYGCHVYIITLPAVDINTFVPMVCHQRTGGILFLIIGIFCYIAGWIILFADYIKSGKMQYRRSLRRKLKDKSLPQVERDYAYLLLIGDHILIS